jgi:hypothetical protein
LGGGRCIKTALKPPARPPTFLLLMMPDALTPLKGVASTGGGAALAPDLKVSARGTRKRWKFSSPSVSWAAGAGQGRMSGQRSWVGRAAQPDAAEPRCGRYFKRTNPLCAAA